MRFSAEPGTRLAGSEIPPHMDEVFGIFRCTSWDNTFLEFFVHGDVAYAISEYNMVMESEGQEPVVLEQLRVRPP